MVLTPSVVIAAAIGYVVFIALITWLAESDFFPDHWIKHPLVNVLSLGVYCSAWAYYSATGLADTFGYGYLAFYVGISAAFILYPMMLRPFLRVTKTYQLNSLPDVFAFRYRSRWLGAITVLVMLVAIVPLLSLQITAIVTATGLIAPQLNAKVVGLAVTLFFIVFAVRFGASQQSQDNKFKHLYFTFAIDSLIKLTALFVLGAVAINTVFGSLSGLNSWLSERPDIIETAITKTPNQGWLLLMTLFFIAPLTMPHMFHLLFRDAQNGQSLKLLSWGFPLFLVLISLPILPILWANHALGSEYPPTMAVLGLGLSLQSVPLTLLTYIGGLSASTGLAIIATMALASMTVNHIGMPFHHPKKNEDIYVWILWVRRFLVAFILSAAYVMSIVFQGAISLTTLGLASFIITLQFLPSIIGTLYWQGANKRGIIAGLIAGLATWVANITFPDLSYTLSHAIGIPRDGVFGQQNWVAAAVASISINTLVAVLVSWITPNNRDEVDAAIACMQSSLVKRARKELLVTDINGMINGLSEALGEISARREVARALDNFEYSVDDIRPATLSRIRDQIEANLSGLMGPGAAQSVVKRYLPYSDSAELDDHDIYLIEDQLETYQNRLTGLAGELNRLRRYHRETLENLPMGVCSVGANGKIIMWNQAMAELTGIPTDDCIGESLSSLPSAWHRLLDDFLSNDTDHLHRQQLVNDTHDRWLNLHKAALPTQATGWVDGNVVLVDDQTDIQDLEDELLHADRLASIGGLAAGVAHEIGNPVTGIDCLAQDLMYAENGPEIVKIGEQIRSQTLRVTKIVQTLVNFAHGSKAGNQEHLDHDIHQVIQEAIGLLTLSRQKFDVNFINIVPKGLFVPCDPQRLGQVFINLLSNASDASEPGQDVIVELFGEPTDHRIKIGIVDQGSGIAPEILERVVEPFFTTKGVGKGTGLGLWLAYSIIDEHYGRITFESPPSGLKQSGTRVIITLPKTQNLQAD